MTAVVWPGQTMMVGGNQRGRQFFKQHGWYELGADKIEAKVGSRAASMLFARPQTWSAPAVQHTEPISDVMLFNAALQTC